MSLEIRKLLKKHNITVSFSSGRNIKSLLCSIKDKTPTYALSGVYALSCASCPSRYIGVTKRSFNVRLDEHFGQIINYLISSNNKLTSNYSAHIINNNHMYNREFEVVHLSNNYLRETLEKYYIFIENELRPDKLINEQLNFSNINLFKSLFQHLTEYFE